ncbi:MAG: rhodanese-like domain-containing protein, partial [Acetobacteraceae bacterium]
MLTARGHSRSPREAASEVSRPNSFARSGRVMPPPTILTAAQLSRLVGLPDTPALIDVRTDEDHAADPRMLPGAMRRDFHTVASWAESYADCRHVVVVCQQGLKLSQGVAAWLRHAGVQALSLDGALLRGEPGGDRPHPPLLLAARQARHGGLVSVDGRDRIVRSD